jgi:rhodanese-related sulfurtransferase
MKTAQDMVAAAKAAVREVALADAESAILEADVVIDVREPEEYHGGHIGGALNIPRGMLEFMLSGDPALQDRSLNVVVYCKTSGRAALAAQTMQEMGYLHVSSIAGGYDGWKESGRPTAHPTQPDFT